MKAQKRFCLIVRMRSPAQGDGLGHAGQVAAEEGDVGGLHGHVGARADGDADVGLGQGRGVVDAVADHGHPPAFGLQSGGSRPSCPPAGAPARTRSMPAARATASAVRRWSPVSMTTSSPRPWSVRTAAAAPSLIGSATARSPAARPSTADEDGRLPVAGQGVRPLGPARGVDPARLEKRAVADQDGPSVHLGFQALALEGGEVDRGGDRQPAGLGRLERRPPPSGCSDGRSAAATRARRPASEKPSARQDVGDLGRPLGQRAGLVEDDRGHLVGRLQALAVLDQDAVSRPPCRCRP